MFNNKVKEINELNQRVDKLEAELFEIKNPNGKITTGIQYLTMSYVGRSVLKYVYSYENKIHNIELNYIYQDCSYYKIQVKDGVAYIGVKYYTDHEKYYIVDLKNESSIRVENNSLENFDSVEWIKSN